ncbi:MAG: DUF4347 domain-containing protein, partial [Microcoleaceae cyanobacterium]
MESTNQNQNNSPLSHPIVFVDPRVDNYQTLTNSVSPNTEVVILAPNRDGIAQITDVLKGRTDISSIHILSHGATGSLQLGSTDLNLQDARNYRDSFKEWFGLNGSTATGEKPDIILYGCDVAGDGGSVLQDLSNLTGADVAASNDITGNVSLGGNWVMEVATGQIETPLAFSPEAMQNYQGTLLALTASDFGSLQNAIQVANISSGGDTITLGGNISLTGALPAITGQTDIKGQGFTIDGQGKTRAFIIDNGATVSLEKLTISNGKSQ